MGIGRSAFYDTPDARARDLSIVAEMKTICDEFEAYGYRRVDAELRHRGIVVNAKKIRRLMREHALNPRQRRRFIATTDSDHNYPVFPNLAKNMKLDGPNQLWVADITYVTIATGFVYLAAILDAWSRRVVGYAISRSMHGSLLLHSRPPSAPAIRQGVACIIPTVGRSMPPKTIAPSCKSTVSPAPWAGAAIPTTTPRPRAS
jgi:putative transposase